jgi:hypothetical protein
MMIFNSIHLPANDIISFFFIPLNEDRTLKPVTNILSSEEEVDRK